MPMIDDHPLRYQLANELHARPFPSLEAPCRAAYLAIKQPKDAAQRDREADRAHLLALLDRFGAQHPQPGATHYFGEIGKHKLKWESHTEFVTYTVFGPGVAERPFDAADTFERLSRGVARRRAGDAADLGADPGGGARRRRGDRRRARRVVRGREPGREPGARRRGDHGGRLPDRSRGPRPLRRLRAARHGVAADRADRAAALRDRDLQDDVDAGARPGAGERGAACGRWTSS